MHAMYDSLLLFMLQNRLSFQMQHFFLEKYLAALSVCLFVCLFQIKQKSSVEYVICVQWVRYGCPLYIQCFHFPLLNVQLITNTASKP